MDSLSKIVGLSWCSICTWSAFDRQALISGDGYGRRISGGSDEGGKRWVGRGGIGVGGKPSRGCGWLWKGGEGRETTSYRGWTRSMIMMIVAMIWWQGWCGGRGEGGRGGDSCR